jgi:hypothetical protein
MVKARLQCLQRLNYPRLAMQMAVAAAPAGTENRGQFMRAVRKAALRTVSATADDLAGLSSALEDVAAKYTDMPSTGIFELANSADLNRVLFLPAAPASVAASAVSPAKGLPPPPAPPAAGQPPVPQPAAQSAPSVLTTPAEHLAAIEAYIAASGGPVQQTSCGAVPVPADVPPVRTLQDAATGLHCALATVPALSCVALRMPAGAEDDLPPNPPIPPLSYDESSDEDGLPSNSPVSPPAYAESAANRAEPCIAIGPRAPPSDAAPPPPDVPPGLSLVAVAADDQSTISRLASGRSGVLTDNDQPVDIHRRRPAGPRAPSVATAVIAFALCACLHQLPGGPCLGRPALGSDLCESCCGYTAGGCCADSARPPSCAAIVPPRCYTWDPGATKSVFFGSAAGPYSYSIARLTAVSDAMSLAWDVLPPDPALADVRRACPELLQRIVYVQARSNKLITPDLVCDMLAGLCDAGFADVVEMLCGPDCTATAARYGRQRDPRRRIIDGVLAPVTFEGAVADVFYRALIGTVRHILAPADSVVLTSMSGLADVATAHHRTGTSPCDDAPPPTWGRWLPPDTDSPPPSAVSMPDVTADVYMHNFTSVPGHPDGFSPHRLATGVHPVFAAVSFGATLYVHIPKDARAGARGRGSNPAASRAEACIAIGPRPADDSMPLLLTDRATRKVSRTTLFAPSGCPLGVLSESPPVLPASAVESYIKSMNAVLQRTSQLGYIGIVGEAPIVWSSKSTTVQVAAHQLPAGFTRGRPIVAHPAIADNHADVSSAAAEIYAAGNATMDSLALSYVCSEAGIAFPERFTLQIDNAAAQSFASQTSYAGKSRLRHIDARQEWLQALRDSNLVKTVHVDTSENIYDMFTKALPLVTFLGFRKQLMHFHSIPITA